MADFSKPDNLSDYANVWDYVKDVQESLALWQDGTTDTNTPTGAKRYSSANKRFEEYDGSSWDELIPLDTDQANAYQIRVAKANSVDLADLATNALRLGSVLASEFVQTTDTRMTDARQCNNTFANVSTARTNLDVHSKYDVVMLLLQKADLASPALTGNPTCPTQAVGNNSTRIASTAFVAASSFVYGAWTSLAVELETGWTTRGNCRVRTLSQAGVVAAYEYEIELKGDGTNQTVMGSIPSNLLPTIGGYPGNVDTIFTGWTSDLGLTPADPFPVYLYGGSLMANTDVQSLISIRTTIWVI